MLHDPIKLIDDYVHANPDLVEPLLERARQYLAAGDGDSLLMMAAVLVGLGNAMKAHVEDNAVIVKDELTLEDCLKRQRGPRGG